jgi:hypothetical protein
MDLKETREFVRIEQEREDLQSVLDTPSGRRFVWHRVLGASGVFRSSFVAGAVDVTSFNEGSRNFGLILLADIMSQLPESFLLMQKEAIQDERKRQTELERSKKDTESGDSFGSEDNGGDWSR